MGDTTPTQDKKDLSPLDPLIAKWKGIDGGLIPLLQETQDVLGYLPREALEKIASEMKIPLAKVFGIVTFYAQFHVQPKGQNTIRVCMGTACYMRGGAKIMERLEKELGITSGETTPDQAFTLESVACIGACSLAPVITVNDETHGRLTPDQVPGILSNYRAPGEKKTEAQGEEERGARAVEPLRELPLKKPARLPRPASNGKVKRPIPLFKTRKGMSP